MKIPALQDVLLLPPRYAYLPSTMMKCLYTLHCIHPRWWQSSVTTV